MPVEIAQPAAEQQEAAEGEHVCVHDPYERGLGEGQIIPDRRQRNVHDRRVENDHQDAGAEHIECPPALPDADALLHDCFSATVFRLARPASKSFPTMLSMSTKTCM